MRRGASRCSTRRRWCRRRAGRSTARRAGGPRAAGAARRRAAPGGQRDEHEQDDQSGQQRHPATPVHRRRLRSHGVKHVAAHGIAAAADRCRRADERRVHDAHGCRRRPAVRAAGRAMPVLRWYDRAARDLPWRAPGRRCLGRAGQRDHAAADAGARVLPAYEAWLDALAHTGRPGRRDTRRGGADVGQARLSAARAAAARLRARDRRSLRRRRARRRRRAASRCRASAPTPPEPWPRSRTASGTRSSTPTSGGSSRGRCSARARRARRRPRATTPRSPRCCRTSQPAPPGSASR